MASITADVVLDRVRSICAGPPFALHEAQRFDSFNHEPGQIVDQSFRIELEEIETIGESGYLEDRIEELRVWVARKHAGDQPEIRRRLLRQAQSLVSAIITDAHVTSGDYGIRDEGRSRAIEQDDGSDYIVLRLTLPVQYETALR